jgi:hypothetical protein
LSAVSAAVPRALTSIAPGSSAGLKVWKGGFGISVMQEKSGRFLN